MKVFCLSYTNLLSSEYIQVCDISLLVKGTVGSLPLLPTQSTWQWFRDKCEDAILCGFKNASDREKHIGSKVGKRLV
ncbi:unnamed protein product [Linum tenue]|uniref:Uncharacterized protein n=1 Tax=Linum tenue TaxID=586396 RepID=A0AAV0MGJ7_9ROSI|nr:unnamed protein product [Linum tenue]